MNKSDNRPRSSAYLALDQGGHASRAFLFTARRELLAQAQVPIATRRIGTDRVEHDADEVADSLREAATTAVTLARAAGFAGDIVAAGLATQRSSIVCWDRLNLSALSPVLSWQDRRNAAWLGTLTARADEICAISGLPLSAHYGASKLRWCLENLPTVQSAASRERLRLGPLASFLSARLNGGASGGDSADPANASRTQLFDLAQTDWSPILLAHFGIERDWLPPVGGTCARRGELDILGHCIPLSAVTGDQSAVPFAWRAPDTADVYLNIGTGAFIQRPVGARAVTAPPLLSSVLRIDTTEVLFSLEGTVNGAASALEQFAKDQQTDLPSLWPLLETPSVHGPGELCYLNGVSGLGSPWWRSNFTSRFIGSGELAQRWVAVLESIIFLIRANYELLAAQRTPARVIVSGGLANSDWLCQRLATLLGIPIMRPAEVEATILGVLGLLAPRAVPAPATNSDRAFLPRSDPPLEARYRRWRELMDQAADDSPLR